MKGATKDLDYRSDLLHHWHVPSLPPGSSSAKKDGRGVLSDVIV